MISPRSTGSLYPKHRRNVTLSIRDGANPAQEGQKNPAAPKRSALLRAALEYAEAGTPVFPCRPGRKEPVIPKCPASRGLYGEELAEHTRVCPRDGHGHHDATTDRSKITAWWNRWPEANIGVPTGKRSGWLVLDQDHPAAMDALEEEHGPLPPTRTHGTGSGGMHLIFRYPSEAGQEIRNSAGRLAECLDVRGEGGYVVVPPSVTTRPYEVLDKLPLADPAWLLEALTAPKEASRSTTPRALPAAIDSGPIPKHRRNDTLTSIAGRLHDGSRTLDQLTADLMEVRDERCEEPGSFPDAEVAKIAASIHRREPCRPQGKRAPEEVQRALLAFEEKLDEITWSGHASNRLSLLKTYILEGRKHGELREDGVAVSVSNSQASLHNRSSLAAIKRNKAKLKEEGWIASDNEGREATDSGVVVLLIPLSEHHDNATEPGCEPTQKPRSSVVGEDVTQERPPGGGGRLTSQRVWSAARARHGKPLYEAGELVGFLGRMGKRAELAVDLLEEAGGRLSEKALAAAMGIQRPRNMNASMWLSRLLDAGVVERDAEGYLSLTEKWLSMWDRRRVEDEEEADRVRDQERYKRMSEAWAQRLAEHAEERRQRRLDREALACFDGELPPQVAGFTHELEPVEEAAVGSGVALEGVEAQDAAGEFSEGRPDGLSELAGVLGDFLRRCPRRTGERPSWLATYVWSEEMVGWKPTPDEVAAALVELGRIREAAA